MSCKVYTFSNLLDNAKLFPPLTCPTYTPSGSFPYPHQHLVFQSGGLMWNFVLLFFGHSLCFWFAFPWLLMRLSTFSCFRFPLLWKACSYLLPIFPLDVSLYKVCMLQILIHCQVGVLPLCALSFHFMVYRVTTGTLFSCKWIYYFFPLWLVLFVFL